MEALSWGLHDFPDNNAGLHKAFYLITVQDNPKPLILLSSPLTGTPTCGLVGARMKCDSYSMNGLAQGRPMKKTTKKYIFEMSW